MRKPTQPLTKEAQQSVNWPALPFARDDVYLETVLEDQLLLMPSLFTAKDCTRWIQFFESDLNFEPSPKARRGEAHRTNDRFSSQDPSFASKLWSETALSTLFSSYPSIRNPAHKAIGLNPNIRIYRYTPGQLFRKHYDDSITSDGLTSEWTLLIYLSGLEDGVIGGETVFDLVQGKKTTKEMVVPLNRGTALLHRHGHECMLHEGREVKHGDKWVLRSDVLFGPP